MDAESPQFLMFGNCWIPNFLYVSGFTFGIAVGHFPSSHQNLDPHVMTAWSGSISLANKIFCVFCVNKLCYKEGQNNLLGHHLPPINLIQAYKTCESAIYSILDTDGWQRDMVNPLYTYLKVYQALVERGQNQV